MSSGKITTEYTAWCSTCNVHDTYAHGGTKKHAMADFRRRGWRAKNGLWVCPQCAMGITPPTLDELRGIFKQSGDS